MCVQISAVRRDQLFERPVITGSGAVKQRHLGHRPHCAEPDAPDVNREVPKADPAGAASVVSPAVDQLGQLDALVLSHWVGVDSGTLDTTVESFDRHYAVNVRPPGC